jgi:hypothetical protein
LSPPKQITAASIANQGTALEIVPPDANTRRQENSRTFAATEPGLFAYEGGAGISP